MIYYKEFPAGFDRKKETEFAQEVLLSGLKEEYGIDTLPLIVRTELGKPFFPDFPDIFFNYSHSKSACACALSSEPIGIDIEDIKDYKEGVAHYICHDNEWKWLQRQENKAERFIMLWTMKEAYLKYTGEGIRQHLNKMDLSQCLIHNQKVTYQGVWLDTRKLEHSCISICKKSNLTDNILHL